MSGRLASALLLVFLLSGAAMAAPVELDGLISEALENNHDIILGRARWQSATFRPPQARSLPDPMLMLGYQNEGFDDITYGDMEDSQLMLTVSQTFPAFGKLPLKGKMAEKEAEGLNEALEAARQKTVSDVREKYYDLFIIHKSLELIDEKRGLFLKVEEAASARYSTGMAPQQEVLMAQTEKYMLDERSEMLRQRLEGAEALLNLAVGREDIRTPLGKPAEPSATPFNHTLEELIDMAAEKSPEVKEKQRMVEASKYRVSMAKKEYYPDVTLTAGVASKPDPFEDMWSLQVAFNIPVFYRQKQRSGVLEADHALAGAEHELEATRLMVESSLRENYSMVRAAEKLMPLYADALIPKARQNYESALAGYHVGNVDLSPLIRSLTTLLDNELLYWNQFIEREKAIARIDAITGSGPVPKTTLAETK